MVNTVSALYKSEAMMMCGMDEVIRDPDGQKTVSVLARREGGNCRVRVGRDGGRSPSGEAACLLCQSAATTPFAERIAASFFLSRFPDDII